MIEPLICVDAKGARALTEGKAYVPAREGLTQVFIMNDLGDLLAYDPKRFTPIPNDGDVLAVMEER